MDSMDNMDKTHEYAPPEITVLMQPQNKEFAFPRPKTVMQLLNKLDIKRGTALVIRDQGLLTEDQRIFPGQHITIRIVTSSG